VCSSDLSELSREAYHVSNQLRQDLREDMRRQNGNGRTETNGEDRPFEQAPEETQRRTRTRKNSPGLRR